MASLKTFLQTLKTATLAESTLSSFGQYVSCSQAGWFNPEQVEFPNLVISPAREDPRPDGRRLLNARDDLVTVTFYAYQEGFGTEEGLFGSGDDTFLGILDIAARLRAFLDGNQIAGTTVPKWVSTEYPTYERNFQFLSEVRLTYTYGLRGAFS